MNGPQGISQPRFRNIGKPFSSKVLFSGVVMAQQDNERFSSVPDVDIEECEGRYKYILIKVYDANVTDADVYKYIVRGFRAAGFHADIYDNVLPVVEKNGLECECVGGGRIDHSPKNKTLKAYGYSQGFGRADHSITSDLLKKKYPDYSITWSNEGY
ncbi:unnamed protein product [Owenia fusiformis]|uniref:Uncharacterized protein n=1 Tax=Owenia fusiformis TaxID=6347 RepID=A0A8J1Y2T5_OWEFU|nr:unnamed protein product [Owenia fusiformis]